MMEVSKTSLVFVVGAVDMWIMRFGTQHRGNPGTPRGEIDHSVRMVDNLWMDWEGSVGKQQGEGEVWISGWTLHMFSTSCNRDNVGMEIGVVSYSHQRRFECTEDRDGRERRPAERPER